MSTITLPVAIDAAAYLRELETQRCERSLVYFIRQAWHVLEPAQPYVHNWHIDLLCEHLEAISAGEQVNGKPYNRLLINVPPGAMKSLILNVFWPSWEWGPKNRPHLRYLCVAHKIENLSERDAGKMLNLVTSDWYQKRWGERVVLTNDAKLSFHTKATGWRIATSIGGITGIRGDRLLIDDPHSVKGATSEATMKSEVENFLEATPTRVNNPIKSAIIVIMQRLREDDISGVIIGQLNKENPDTWDHIMLPMRFDKRRSGPTMLGTQDPREEEGELLFPERFPEDVLRRDEGQMGPYGTAAQHQQEPAPRGGGVIKDDWWNLWDTPTRDKPDYPPMDFIVASLDTAYATKEENDYSAMTIWGVFTTQGATQGGPSGGGRYGSWGEVDIRPYVETSPRVLLMYAWNERLEFPDLVAEVTKWCKKYAVDTLLIENKASGISLGQELRRSLGHEAFGVRLIDPHGGDKLSRLYSVQHLFAPTVDREGKVIPGIVWAPDKEWAEMVIDQVRKFPKGKHDDLVDTCSQALRFLRDSGLLTRAPERIAEIGESMRNIGRSPPALYAS